MRVSNALDQDQARRLVGPDLDPNCLQRLSTDDTCMLRVNTTYIQPAIFCIVVLYFYHSFSKSLK